MTFAQHVKHTRERLHITQQEMADALAVEKQTVSNWECERNAPWPRQQVEILSKLLTMVEPPQARERVCDRI